MTALIQMEGMRFSNLVVLSRESNHRLGQARWLCKCDCGETTVVSGVLLRRGKTRSCGCLAIKTVSEMRTTHGRTKTKPHRAWANAKNRCFNENYTLYHRYGGRGIRVCDRWINGDGNLSGFECFLADMGEPPTNKHSLDRIDLNGHYEPANCRWATDREQQNNKCTTLKFTIGSETKSLSDWARSVGLKPDTVGSRVRVWKWPIEKALAVGPHQNSKKVTVARKGQRP